MYKSPLNELDDEIDRDYGEWLEESLYSREEILSILLLKEREKSRELRWQK